MNGSVADIPTPETDAEQLQFGIGEDRKYVSADFARRLERRLYEVQKADYWGRKYDSAMKELEIEFRRTTELRAEVEKLLALLQRSKETLDWLYVTYGP